MTNREFNALVLRYTEEIQYELSEGIINYNKRRQNILIQLLNYQNTKNIILLLNVWNNLQVIFFPH